MIGKTVGNRYKVLEFVGRGGAGAPTKERVLETNAKFKKKDLKNLAPQLKRASGFAFYNTSQYDFDKMTADPPSGERAYVLIPSLRNPHGFLLGLTCRQQEYRVRLWN